MWFSTSIFHHVVKFYRYRIVAMCDMDYNPRRLSRIGNFVSRTCSLPCDARFEWKQAKWLFCVVLTTAFTVASLAVMPEHVAHRSQALPFDQHAILSMVLLWLALMFTAFWHRILNVKRILRIFKDLASLLNGRERTVNGCNPFFKLFAALFYVFGVLLFVSISDKSAFEIVVIYSIYVFILVKYYLDTEVYSLLIDVWSESVLSLTEATRRSLRASDSSGTERVVASLPDHERILRDIYQQSSLEMLCLVTAGSVTTFNNLYFQYMTLAAWKEAPHSMSCVVDLVLKIWSNVWWLLMVFRTQTVICFKPSQATSKVAELSHSLSNFLTRHHQHLDHRSTIFKIEMVLACESDLEFSVYGLKIDKRALHAMLATVSTYLVILVQFREDSKPPQAMPLPPLHRL